MTQSPSRFAELLQEGINATAKRAAKPKGVIRDELGYAIGRKGGSAIEYWAYGDGHIPKDPAEVEKLARMLIEIGELDDTWLAAFLASAGYPDGEGLLYELFPTTAKPPLHNLPSPVTPFVGRQTQLALLTTLLTSPDCRLITLTGVGGIGKTRLAMEVGRRLTATFTDGILFVDLTSIQHATLIPAVLADALQIRESAGNRPLLEHIAEHLQAANVLLIIDNFEHLIEGALLLGELLAKTERLCLLVTSREPLRLLAEQIVSVPPLALPSMVGSTVQPVLGDVESVQLFAQHALALQADRSFDAAELQTIGDICIRLDGLPLAIELAAAQTNLFTIVEIAERLAVRFTLLQRELRDTPMRHHSLLACIDWSYALLSGDEQHMFNMLAIFEGGGRQKLREGGLHETVAERHAHYYLGLAEQAEPKLYGVEQANWLKRLFCDHDNLRAALGWFIAQGDVANATRLGVALWHFWYIRSYHREGIDCLEQILTLKPSSVERAKLLYGQGMLLRRLHDDEAITAKLSEALTLFDAVGDEAYVASALRVLGFMDFRKRRFDAALAKLEQAARLFERVNNDEGVAVTLMNLGYVQLGRRHYPAAQTSFEKSLAMRRRSGNEHGVANCLDSLGYTLLHRKEYKTAKHCLLESQRIYRALGNHVAERTALEFFGAIAYIEGDYVAADSHFADAYQLAQATGSSESIFVLYPGWALTKLRLQHTSEASTLIHDALAFFAHNDGSEHGTLSLAICSLILLTGSKPVHGLQAGIKALAMVQSGETAALWATVVAELSSPMANARRAISPERMANLEHEASMMSYQDAIAFALHHLSTE